MREWYHCLIYMYIALCLYLYKILCFHFISDIRKHYLPLRVFKFCVSSLLSVCYLLLPWLSPQYSRTPPQVPSCKMRGRIPERREGITRQTETKTSRRTVHSGALELNSALLTFPSHFAVFTWKPRKVQAFLPSSGFMPWPRHLDIHSPVQRRSMHPLVTQRYWNHFASVTPCSNFLNTGLSLTSHPVSSFASPPHRICLKGWALHPEPDAFFCGSPESFRMWFLNLACPWEPLANIPSYQNAPPPPPPSSSWWGFALPLRLIESLSLLEVFPTPAPVLHPHFCAFPAACALLFDF